MYGYFMQCTYVHSLNLHTCALQVEAANAKVERGNQARQSDFSGAADRLRKLSTAEYEARRPPFACSASLALRASHHASLCVTKQTIAIVLSKRLPVRSKKKRKKLCSTPTSCSVSESAR